MFNYTKGKSRKTGKGKTPLKKIPTCTIKFCCLGFVDSDKPPTTVAAKTALANSGLGPSSGRYERQVTGHRSWVTGLRSRSQVTENLIIRRLHTVRSTVPTFDTYHLY